MKGKQRKRRAKIDGGAKVVPGRKPAAFPLQRLTIQATDDELQLIKKGLATRQRAELLIAHAKDILTLLARRRQEMTFSWEIDDRHKESQEDGYRLGRLKAGWAYFVNGNRLEADTLKKLTWYNLGYRIAALLKPEPELTHRYNDEAKKCFNQMFDAFANLHEMNLEIRKGKSPQNRP
jgi:hypothetical protein